VVERLALVTVFDGSGGQGRERCCAGVGSASGLVSFVFGSRMGWTYGPMSEGVTGSDGGRLTSVGADIVQSGRLNRRHRSRYGRTEVRSMYLIRAANTRCVGYQ
jgi:hypothetical protein